MRKRSDKSFWQDAEAWMVVARDRTIGLCGWHATLYLTRKEALAARRKLVNMREIAVRVRIAPARKAR